MDLIFDCIALNGSKAIAKDGNNIPHGYVLPNGVCVVWQNPTRQNNFATKEYAIAMFPHLHLHYRTPILFNAVQNWHH